MKHLLVLLSFTIAASAQSQLAPCGTSPASAANPVASGRKSPVAAKAGPAAPAEEAAAQVRRPPAVVTPAPSCRCGTVGAGSLTAPSNSQEVPILTGLAGSFRFDHVLLQETTQFSSANVASLAVGVGRANFGADVVSPFPLESNAAPYNYWYERPTPPQLRGAYDLVLSFQASGPLGDGTVSNFSSGAVAWEVCGYNSSPAPAK
jgi:hypothetical protein